jgi:hypothetical protein
MTLLALFEKLKLLSLKSVPNLELQQNVSVKGLEFGFAIREETEKLLQSDYGLRVE